MAQILDLVPEVRTHLSGAPDITVELYLRRAVIQFCRDSRIWDVRIGQATVRPAMDDSEIEVPVPSIDPVEDFVLPDSSIIRAISAVTLNDEDPLEGEYYAYSKAEAVLTLARRTVSRESTLRVKAILTPIDTAREFPNFLDEWRSGIVDYAIYEMLTMPNQAWSDPILADHFNNEYDKRVAEATVEKARQGTEKPIRLQPIPFI